MYVDVLEKYVSIYDNFSLMRLINQGTDTVFTSYTGREY